jgi:hypothetical protein
MVAEFCSAGQPMTAILTHETQRDSGSPSLFGLAPCGVCPARVITVAAVRSYRTFSPLPRPFHKSSCNAIATYRTGGAVCFLWHFPSAELELGVPDVIRHTALRSSDFPPRPFSRPREFPSMRIDMSLKRGRDRQHGRGGRPVRLPTY